MALKLTIADLVEVPGDIRQYYRPTQDGKFTLDVETVPDSEKVAEFRNKNIALMKELDELRPLKGRPDATDLQSQLAAERAAHAATQLRHATTTEFLKQGGRPSAVDYISDAAAKVFTVEDGKVTSKEFSATDPAAPLTLAEWIKAKSKDEDYCFLPSHGGGARPSSGPSLFGQRPGTTVLKNPTPQDLGRHAADIASGKVRVEHDG